MPSIGQCGVNSSPNTLQAIWGELRNDFILGCADVTPLGVFNILSTAPTITRKQQRLQIVNARSQHGKLTL